METLNTVTNSVQNTTRNSTTKAKFIGLYRSIDCGQPQGGTSAFAARIQNPMTKSCIGTARNPQLPEGKHNYLRYTQSGNSTKMKLQMIQDLKSVYMENLNKISSKIETNSNKASMKRKRKAKGSQPMSIKEFLKHPDQLYEPVSNNQNLVQNLVLNEVQEEQPTDRQQQTQTRESIVNGVLLENTSDKPSTKPFLQQRPGMAFRSGSNRIPQKFLTQGRFSKQLTKIEDYPVYKSLNINPKVPRNMRQTETGTTPTSKGNLSFQGESQIHNRRYSKVNDKSSTRFNNNIYKITAEQDLKKLGISLHLKELNNQVGFAATCKTSHRAFRKNSNTGKSSQ